MLLLLLLLLQGQLRLNVHLPPKALYCVAPP
jgi:hypothetical protein